MQKNLPFVDVFRIQRRQGNRCRRSDSIHFANKLMHMFRLSLDLIEPLKGLHMNGVPAITFPGQGPTKNPELCRGRTSSGNIYSESDFFCSTADGILLQHRNDQPW